MSVAVILNLNHINSSKPSTGFGSFLPQDTGKPDPISSALIEAVYASSLLENNKTSIENSITALRQKLEPSIFTPLGELRDDIIEGLTSILDVDYPKYSNPARTASRSKQHAIAAELQSVETNLLNAASNLNQLRTILSALQPQHNQYAAGNIAEFKHNAGESDKNAPAPSLEEAKKLTVIISANVFRANHTLANAAQLLGLDKTKDTDTKKLAGYISSLSAYADNCKKFLGT